MTAALVAMMLVCCALMAAHVRTLDKHEAEREQWAAERKQLVDRAIARHTGEVIAFDREGRPRPERVESPYDGIVGLS